MKKAEIKDTVIELTFQTYDKSEFFAIVEFVKGFFGRKFNPSTKKWTIPYNSDNVQKLQNYGFEVSGIDLVQKEKINIEQYNLDDRMFDFQKDGVKFLMENRGGILSDQMGLGKSNQALQFCKVSNFKKVLIICPASLKLNWKKEIEMWTDYKNVKAINGSKDIIAGTVVILNYSILQHYTDVLSKYNFDVIIYDELHYCKNPKSIRSKALVKVAKKIKYKVAISGTPIVNKPIEYFTTLNLLKPEIFNNRFYFGKEFCNAKHNGFGWDFSGASNLEKLYKLLSGVMIRRKKEDVLKDLPDKLHTVINFELEGKNKKIYNDAADDIISFIYEREGKAKAEKASYHEILVRFEKLKQLIYECKRDQIFEWIDNFLETGEKIVLFATHKKVISEVMGKYNKLAVKIDGSVNSADRDKAVMEFQNNKDVKIFIGNIQAAGVGLTLTAASNVAFLELPWTPGELTQAEDRCHRIGQKNAVSIYYFVIANTIDTEILELLQKKQAILNAVLDGQAIDEKNVLSELIKNIKNN